MRDAPRYGLDPRAVAAVAYNESGGSRYAVGDGGTSFGFAQLHKGGALPASHYGDAQQWAASRAGVDYVLSRMGSVASGLKGLAAIRNIAYRFERPADPAAESATAWRWYSGGQQLPSGGAPQAQPTGPGGPRPSGGGPSAQQPRGNPAAALAALGLIQPVNPQLPLRQYPTALQTVQNFIAAHAPIQTAAQPTAQPFATQIAQPDYGGQLNAIHDQLLKS